MTLCLVRSSTVEHDRWALRNLWGTFPGSRVILVGDPLGIFTEEDQRHQPVEATETIEGVVKIFKREPTPYLFFLKSTIMPPEEWKRVQLSEQGETPFSFGNWRDGFFGIFGFDRLRLPMVKFFETTVADKDFIMLMCIQNKVPHRGFTPFYPGLPPREKKPTYYTRIEGVG